MEVDVAYAPGYKVPKKSEIEKAIATELANRELTVHCDRGSEFFGTRIVVKDVKAR